MKYEWDENKRVANLAKHDVDFVDAEHFDWSSAMEAIDDRFNYSEERWVALVLTMTASMFLPILCAEKISA